MKRRKSNPSPPTRPPRVERQQVAKLRPEAVLRAFRSRHEPLLRALKEILPR